MKNAYYIWVAIFSTFGAAVHADEVAHYKFDDGQNGRAADVVVDSSVNGLNGEAAKEAGNPVYAEGQLGGSLDFRRGLGKAFVKVLDKGDSPLDLTGSLTLEAFIRPNDVNQLQVIVRKCGGRGGNAGGPGGYGFQIDDAGKLGFFLFDDQNMLTSKNAIRKGVFQHVAASWDGSTMRLFLNYELVNSKEYSGRLNANDSDFGIGALLRDNGTSGQYFNGQIDEVRVSDTALQPSEFVRVPESVTGSGKPDIVTGLVHHWKFDEKKGDIAFDSVGNNLGVLKNWGTEENKWRKGIVGGALDFGDVDNYVITKLPISQDQYTISFWLNLNRRHGLNPRIVGPRDGLHNWVVISNEDDLGVGFYHDHGRNLVQDQSQPVVETWEHYAIVFDRVGGKAEVFRDGVSVAEGKVDDAMPLDRWMFGHHDNFSVNSGSLDGRLDDLRIYSRLLTSSDVAELYNSVNKSAVSGQDTISVMTWNVESGGNDAGVVANELSKLMEDEGPFDIVGLTGVRQQNSNDYVNALGGSFTSVTSNVGGKDRMVIAFNEEKFDLVRTLELSEYDGIAFNHFDRQGEAQFRSPLAVELQEKNGERRLFFMVNHLARNNGRNGGGGFREQQARGLVAWAKDQSIPVIMAGVLNADFNFETGDRNSAFSILFGDDDQDDQEFQWIRPEEMIDTHQSGDSGDRSQNTIVDFVTVAKAPEDWKVIKSKVIVRPGDLPDNSDTSNHRPVMALFQSNPPEFNASELLRRVRAMKRELEEIEKILEGRDR